MAKPVWNNNNRSYVYNWQLHTCTATTIHEGIFVVCEFSWISRMGGKSQKFADICTVKRWFHRLELFPTSHKSGVYIDGYEWVDVVVYRHVYLQKVEIQQWIHHLPPLCNDCLVPHGHDSATVQRKLVLICSDTLYNMFSSMKVIAMMTMDWARELAIKPNRKGHGLMVSDFVNEHCRFLCLSTEEKRKRLPT